MDRTVATLNIEHFKTLLAKETDEAKRATILRLLGEEEAKLAIIEAERHAAHDGTGGRKA